MKSLEFPRARGKHPNSTALMPLGVLSRREGARGMRQGLSKLRDRGQEQLSRVPSLLLLLRRPLHRLLDLLLLLLARNLGQGDLPCPGGHRALRGQHHHGGHVRHGGHLVAHDPLGAVAGAVAVVAGGATAVAGGALGAVAASVLTGAHFQAGGRGG